MCISRKTVASCNSQSLHRLVSRKWASLYHQKVQDVPGSRFSIQRARHIEDDASYLTVDCHMSTGGLSKHAHLTDKQYLENSYLRPHSCSLYAKSLIFKSSNSNTKLVNTARLHSTERGTAKSECRSCGKSKSEKGFLVCPSCNAVQALNPDITYFDIFDLDQTFELDARELETKYKSLMKKVHPDLTHGKSTEEKERYAQWSALVTTAYTELLKPVSRGTYLLKLRGIHVEEEGTVTDSDLIMEVMDIRETLQSRPNRQMLEELNKIAMARMGEWSRAFIAALEDGNDVAAVAALQRMSYFGRVCEDITRELL